LMADGLCDEIDDAKANANRKTEASTPDGI
jgi:hypothetical protein